MGWMTMAQIQTADGCGPIHAAAKPLQSTAKAREMDPPKNTTMKPTPADCVYDVLDFWQG